MKNGKLLILLMTVVFLMLAAGIRYMEPAPEPNTEVNIPLSVTALLDGQQEQIQCWVDAAGDGIIFLPSGVELSDVVISLEEDTQAVLNQKPLEEFMDCSDFLLDTPYPLSCTAEAAGTVATITQSRNRNGRSRYRFFMAHASFLPITVIVRKIM